ncbi:ABC transporter ATP-binding protein [Robertmurraya sp. DFI.2.37]|uniref:ABC transporter ATP-binding protein n=1 Tax=Robertmurraya sp. DFI.2.37 TaxID=3031819 RepID=UPI00124862CE|nr:ABC transporter ATP-binding protein [Robertmurraya sp. DFI.2.37]MDF1510265.1 ABC transporter ATP-binding protein [Robertmurraya sp. DFI.2.37]
MDVNGNRKMGAKRFVKMINEFMPSKWIQMLAIGLVIIETALSLVVPLLTKDIVDHMNIAQLDKKAIFLLGVVFISQLFMSTFALYAMNYIGQKVVLKLREKVWNKVLELPITFFDRHSSGETMSRITNDTLIVKDFVTGQLIPFVSGVISIIGAVVLLLLIDWQMTVLMFLGVPLAILILAPLSKSIYKVSRSLQDETAMFQGDLGRVLTDIRLVKSSLAEKQEKQMGLNRMKKLFQFGIKEAKILSIIQPLTMSVTLMLLVAIFGYGSIRVAAGTLSAGSLIAIIFYLFQITVPFSQLTSFFSYFQKALGASERLDYILSTKSEPNVVEATDVASNPNSLSFHQVSFSYLEDKPILFSVNFEAEIGKMTAFVGPSGSGKTTLFSLLERFYLPNSGSITYKGKSIHHIPLEEWRGKIAYVSQESPMMSGTIRSNLTYGLSDISEEQMNEAVANANLKDFIASLPQGYETEVGERGISLSGGQRQRLAIARAMIRNPQILLLDEATAHLDSKSEKLVQDALEKLMKGRTTLVIAHRLSTVKHADQLIILENGNITGVGTHHELYHKHPLYKEFVEQQLEVVSENEFVNAGAN